MSGLCPNGCGHTLRDCCDSAIGDNHMLSCPVRIRAEAASSLLRIDDWRIHLARIEFLEVGVRLICIAGCDLSQTTGYERVSHEVLADADLGAICPGLLRAEFPPAVPYIADHIEVLHVAN
jgi:hypothetical protein